MDLHPYDNKERRYRHTDSEMSDGIRIVTKLLCLFSPPPAIGLLYDLSFFSGGIGVVDKLAITLPTENISVPSIVASLQFKSPEDAVSDAGWKDDFLWLVDDEDDPLPVRGAVARFINENRSGFQPQCGASDLIWFEAESNVNHWTALWETEGALSYLSYDQG
jgi:hypothetical protein